MDQLALHHAAIAGIQELLRQNRDTESKVRDEYRCDRSITSTGRGHREPIGFTADHLTAERDFSKVTVGDTLAIVEMPEAQEVGKGVVVTKLVIGERVHQVLCACRVSADDRLQCRERDTTQGNVVKLRGERRL